MANHYIMKPTQNLPQQDHVFCGVKQLNYQPQFTRLRRDISYSSAMENSLKFSPCLYVIMISSGVIYRVNMKHRGGRRLFYKSSLEMYWTQLFCQPR